MASLLTAEVERIAEAVAFTLGGFTEMLGLPTPEWARELGAEMAEDIAVGWSACAVMADATQPAHLRLVEEF